MVNFSQKNFNQFNAKLPLIKMSGMAALLAGGTYLWMQNSLAETLNDDVSNMKVATFVAPNNPSEPVAVSQMSKLSPLFETKLRFETKLSYEPTEYHEPAKKAHKKTVLANLTPITKSDAPAELINEIASETSPVAEATIRKQIRSDQKSANYYRQALSYLQQGRVAEAQASLAQALETNTANHEARQVLAGLLLDNKRYDEASATLAAGLAIAPEQTDFRMALARLQIEAGDDTSALNTLEQGLPYAKDHADFQNFLATLLQRAERHQEAIEHYNTALSLNSSSPSALIGLGISLQAVGELAQSQEVFTRVQSSAALSPELSIFVDQRIKQINQSLQN